MHALAVLAIVPGTISDNITARAETGVVVFEASLVSLACHITYTQQCSVYDISDPNSVYM